MNIREYCSSGASSLSTMQLQGTPLPVSLGTGRLRDTLHGSVTFHYCLLLTPHITTHFARWCQFCHFCSSVCFTSPYVSKRKPIRWRMVFGYRTKTKKNQYSSLRSCISDCSMNPRGRDCPDVCSHTCRWDQKRHSSRSICVILGT